MNLKKAIEVVEKWTKHPPGVVFSSELPAVKILIEAGKREMECRENLPHEDWLLLPSETEE